jgi:hypothetical protein
MGGLFWRNITSYNYLLPRMQIETNTYICKFPTSSGILSKKDGNITALFSLCPEAADSKRSAESQTRGRPLALFLTKMAAPTIGSHELQIAGMESSPNEESLYRFRKGSYVLYITLAGDCVLLDGSDYGFPPSVRNLLPGSIDTSYNHAFIDSSGNTTFSIR